jgi:murein DD-endopeptidase MepM/ murein hydrolase activator NlpD
MFEMDRHDNGRKRFTQRRDRFLLCCVAITLFSFASCGSSGQTGDNSQPQTTPSQNKPIIVTYADGFDYPIGKAVTATEAKDKDAWYNAQDFGENNHLGEDWNKNTGGNTDCGEAVYAVANGLIVFAEDAGAGWGNVVIIEHLLADGARVQTLYGHLQTITKPSGKVSRREQIGTVGDGGGRYLCHLHFEVRFVDCPFWNAAGPGYSEDRKGWTDPSKFIDGHRFRSNR